MEITKNIIVDLLPLYITGECSNDTKQLVEEYLEQHPDLQALLPSEAAKHDRNSNPDPLTPRDEMQVLNRTKTLIKRRSYFLAFAIFFSLAPFSFIYIDGTFRWLVLQSLKSTSIYLLLAAIFWIAYFLTKKKI